MKIVLLLLLTLVLLACAASVREPPVTADHSPHYTVYLIGHGWHSGLAVRKTDIPRGLWPESGDFPEAQFLEVGWGDWDFYQAPDFSFWLMLKAGLWPTASVLNVVPLRYAVAEYYPCSDLIELDLSQPRFARLIGYIHGTFARDGSGRVAPLRSQEHRADRFYPARGQFTVFNNCNTWTAKALKEGGYPIRPPYPITAGSLISQARNYGRKLSPTRPCVLR
jgi:uncharacterized protein (TIGR02117 family)